MKVLVTGGAGDIGYWLCRYYSDQGAEVTIVDNFLRGKRDREFSELAARANVQVIEGDLCRLDFVNSLEKDFEYIFHLAALNGTDNFYERPFAVLLNCTLPTLYLLEHYKNARNLKRFLYAGSSEAYASIVEQFGWEIPTDEKVPLGIVDSTNVRWSYGGSKIHGEIACFAASAQYGIPVTVLRFHNVYGPRMGDKHVIPDFVNRASNGIFELRGAAETRSFLYVEDAVRACALAAKCPGTSGQVINIGSQEEIPIYDLAEMIMEIMGKTGHEIKILPSVKGSVHRRCPDIAKCTELTGFKPEISLRDGLCRTVQSLVN